MALSGLQIQKLLPKTNCKECGSNTCLAFAMKLAAKKAELSECPYASDEAKAVLGADSEPPVKAVALGAGDKASTVGGETVLYRHEKTFVHQTMLAIAVRTGDDPEDAERTLENVRDYRLERVGEILTVNAVAVVGDGSDPVKFSDLAKQAADITGLPLILRSPSAAELSAGAKAAGGKCVLGPADESNADELKKIADEGGHALAVTGSGLDAIVALTERLKAAGSTDLFLDFGARSSATAFQMNSIARASALKDGYKPLGYPTLRFIDTGDMATDTVEAVTEIDKYGGVCVLPSFDPAQLVSLMTLRLNIYTDPQKPIQVEPKIYAIGEPDRKSAVFVTTNFSLTYFIVSGEIENSGISAWLVIPECEGMSVLTSWAAGKFSGAIIGKFVKESGLEEMVDTRSIIIPGYVSQISGELEESLPGWKVVVGPQEASDIEGFVKQVLMK